MSNLVVEGHNCGSKQPGCIADGGGARSGQSHVKGGRMIVLQIKKIPLSLIFPGEKKTPFIQKR